MFEKNLSVIHVPSECITVWIQTGPSILLGLIWIQAFCKGYQQKTQVDKDNSYSATVFLSAKCCLLFTSIIYIIYIQVHFRLGILFEENCSLIWVQIVCTIGYLKHMQMRADEKSCDWWGKM